MDPRIGNALKIIRAEFAKPTLTMAQVARQSGLSESRFEHLFRLETGQPFRKWVSHLRAQEAGRLLATNFSLEIKQVAYGVGYSSPSAFTRAFKKWFGIGPSEYRATDITTHRR
jgi:AraC-like DNA-binding protein